MSSISEFLYHATGLCGHVHHPSLINISVIAIVAIVAARLIYKKVNKWKT